MRSALPKVLHPICGRPLLGHVLALTDALEAERTTVVLAVNTIDQVRERFGAGPHPARPYEYVVQGERLGTGHALLQARPVMQGRTDDILVLYGDTPLVCVETAQAVAAARRETGALLSLLSFQCDPPGGYGRIVRDAQARVVGVVEARDATPEQLRITEVNSGIMCIRADWLWGALDRIKRSPIKGEYYLTDLVALAVADAGPGAVAAVEAADPREAWGVNDRVELAACAVVLRERLLNRLMRNGVTIVDPAATYVDADVAVEPECVLLPGVILQGATRVEAGCVIGPHTTLLDAQIGAGSQIRYALVERTSVPAGSVIGPFVHVDGAK
jgi:bifunctional UDP-N-acetylglucosamine pyrophosphorylase/glucosamine-1-phosphate N-acetyltransferase